MHQCVSPQRRAVISSGDRWAMKGIKSSVTEVLGVSACALVHVMFTKMDFDRASQLR